MNSNNYLVFVLFNKKTNTVRSFEAIFVELFSSPECKNSEVLAIDVIIRRSTVVSYVLVCEKYFYC